MAWIAIVPPSPRHPHERYQVCYQDSKRQRSAGIFPPCAAPRPSGGRSSAPVGSRSLAPPSQIKPRLGPSWVST
jgi:hypothetical protein